MQKLMFLEDHNRQKSVKNCFWTKNIAFFQLSIKKITSKSPFVASLIK